MHYQNISIIRNPPRQHIADSMILKSPASTFRRHRRPIYLHLRIRCSPILGTGTSNVTALSCIYRMPPQSSSFRSAALISTSSRNLISLVLSNIRSWFPAMTILCVCGRNDSHWSCACTSSKVPLAVRSPEWIRCRRVIERGLRCVCLRCILCGLGKDRHCCF
jgi:hypothetical protein